MNLLKSTTILLLCGLLLTTSAAETKTKKKDHCYALAMSGGGTIGAYEAGVVYGLVHGATDKSKYAYDVLSGVSAGSINGGAMAIWAPGDELNMVKVLSDVWQTLTTKDIFKFWDFLLIGGLNHSGFTNTQPLKDFIKKYFDQYGYDYKRRVSFAGVDSVDGNYIIFNETLSNEDKINGVMTSSAIPIVFTRQDFMFDGHFVNGIDGGSVWNLNIASAINRCHELVDDDSQITLDIVNCDRMSKVKYDGDDKKHMIHNWLRYYELKSYHEGVADLFEVMQAFPKVNYRHYVQPSQSLGTMAIMDGTNSTCTWPMQLIGRKDGDYAVNREFEMTKKFNDYIKSDDLKHQWPRIGEYVDHVYKEWQPKSDENDKIDIKCSISFLKIQDQVTFKNESPQDILQK